MNKKSLFTVVGLFFILTMTILLTAHENGDAQETRIVRLYGQISSEGTTVGFKRVKIEPETLWISKGTIVVWINQTRTPCLKVIFEDAKKCADVTDAPTGFKKEEQCFVTSWLSRGGTSSLRFNEAGTFDYAVEAEGFEKETRAAGKIIVQ